MLISIGVEAIAGDLATIVDRLRLRQMQGGSTSNQRCQVDHRTTALPQERARVGEIKVRRDRNTHHLTDGVDGDSETSRVTTQRSKIRDLAAPPECRMEYLVIGKGGPSCYLS